MSETCNGQQPTAAVRHLNRLSRAEFYAVPLRQWDGRVECSSLVLLPPRTTALHDSGYRLMDAVACMDNTPLCRVSGCSEVFNLSTPSDIWTADRTPDRPAEWAIDCLARSGLFRIFILNSSHLLIGGALSSLYIHPIKRSSV